MCNNPKIVLAIIVVFVCSMNIDFAERIVNVSIDGEKLIYSEEFGYPFIDQSGRTQVPFKMTMEAFGCVVTWNAASKSAIATMNGVKVEVPIGEQYIIKDGTKVSLDTYAVIRNGRTYLPIAAVLKAFGASVKWDSITSSVIVEKPLMNMREVSKLDLSTITKNANSQRKREIYGTSLPISEQFREDFYDTINYFNDEDVLDILKVKDIKRTLSHEEAISDIETYFKILKSSYGAYTYFGGDTRFEIARKEVIEALDNKSIIDYNYFRDSLLNALSFVRDDHFAIANKRPGITDQTKYVYFYAPSVEFDLDEKGYFQQYENVKWYYKAEDSNYIHVEPTLRSDGTIVYGLIYFGPKSESDLEDHIILSSQNQERKLIVKWTQSRDMIQDPVIVRSDKVYYFNDIPYVPFRRNHFGREAISNYKIAGSKVANEKYIIIDARGNNGSGDPHQFGWMGSFIGDPTYMYDFKQINSYKNSKFSLEAFKNAGNSNASNYSKLGLWNVWTVPGKWIDNYQQIYVLLDNNIGSSGEVMINMLRGVDNVTFIGSNTTGCTICGMYFEAYLPNSGLPIRMGMMLALPENGGNVDGMGLKPDIWCDPSISLEAVIKLIELNRE